MQLALFGLGVMGTPLALRIADTCTELLGGPLHVFDLDEGRRSEFRDQLSTYPFPDRVRVCESAAAALEDRGVPRVVLLLVPAAAVADALASIRPHLRATDTILECGNSFFRDTEARAGLVESAYFGLGVSGGAEGARNGPSLMLGGPAHTTVWPILERMAAQHDGRPCAVYCGPRGSGHYVKMVHNAIEYVLMQSIGECVAFMLGQGHRAGELAAICSEWNDTPELGSYLMEITAHLLGTVDEKTGRPLLEVTSPSVGHKGTGSWALSTALESGVPAPLLAAALFARFASGEPETKGGQAGSAPPVATARSAQAGEPNAPGISVEAVRETLAFLWREAFAEGLGQLAAGTWFGYDIPVGEVLRAWRAGCIIRCTYLDELQQSILGSPEGNPAPADSQRATIRPFPRAAREVAAAAALRGTAMPVLAAALARSQPRHSSGDQKSEPGLALVALQRDFFGHHGFQRLDREGVFHLR